MFPTVYYSTAMTGNLSHLISTEIAFCRTDFTHNQVDCDTLTQVQGNNKNVSHCHRQRYHGREERPGDEAMPAVLCDWEVEQLRADCSCCQSLDLATITPEANGQLSLPASATHCGPPDINQDLLPLTLQSCTSLSRYHHHQAWLIASLGTSLLRIIIYHLLKNDGFQFLARLSSHVAPQLAGL